MTTTTISQPPSRLALVVQRLDFGLLFTLALCSFALWPLLYRPGLPNGNDVLYHVYRAAEMDRAWSHGVILPHWAESFYTGYGAPVFHYYASLSYYVSSLLMRIFGLDALNSLRALIVLCVWGAGAGAYLFLKPRAGRLGGVIAALCYVYCPYMLFTEPYSRGAYPELMALALFPLVMWRFDALLQPLKIRHIIFAALALAALILTHNLMGLVMTGLLAAWLIWETLAHLLTIGRAGIRPYLFALITAALGIGLAAYFWLPVILESGEVHLGNLTAVAQLDYRNFFVPLRQLLAFSPRFDGGSLNGLQHQFNLGVPQWILAGTGFVGVVMLAWVARTRYIVSLRNTIFFALAGSVCVLLLHPSAGAVWGATAPLAFLQFPWRFLGPAGFCLGVVAGMNARWIEKLPRGFANLTVIAVILFIIGLAMPLFYITEWTHPTVDASVAAYQQAEVQGLQRATTFSNEYLPKAVEVEPNATDSLLADYADGYPVNHLNLENLPDGVTADLLDNGPQHSVWQVQAAAPFTMEVLIFDFAGWTAEVDGQAVPITPSDPHGLISFPVPEGDHTVRLYLGSTPARDLGVALTIMSALGVGVIAFIVFRLGKAIEQTVPVAQTLDSLLSSQSSALSTFPRTWLLALSTILVLILVVIYMREGSAWVDSPPGEALLAQHKTAYHLGNIIEMLGYDLNGDSFKPGSRVELRVYWYARAPITYGYASFVHISTGGPPLAQADKLNPAGRPTKEWTSNGYIRDDYTIQLPDNMPPGDYQIRVGLYTCDTMPVGNCGNGERLIVTDADGQNLGDAVVLQTITVR